MTPTWNPKAFLGQINRSFSTRLSAAILLFTMVIFVAAFSLFYHFTSQSTEQDERENADDLLHITNLEIEKVLGRVETVPENLTWIIGNGHIHPDSLYKITDRVVRENPDIYGCAIAFEPYYFPEKGYYYSPYSYLENGDIHRKQLGTENYDYFNWEWYTQCKTLLEPCWSEPYFDEGGGQMLMCTYSAPIFDKNGTFIGVFTSDISLDWLADMLDRQKKNDQTYNFMLSRGGMYIAHFLRERILNETIFTATSSMTDTTILTLGKNMIEGKKGEAVIDNDGVKSYVYYGPISRTGWSLAVVLPEEEIFGALHRIRSMVIVITVLGLLLLFFFCWRIVHRIARPLHTFAHSARAIAHGDFSAQLPEITSRDEMKELSDSFGYMQRELVNYIGELQDTTSAKEKIESELRIAREIQMGMIPKIFPPIPNRSEFDLYAVLHPAKEVGGDLYDFFMDGDELYFAIGDVSGKGVPASLFMAVTRSLFRSISNHTHEPAQIIAQLNNAVSENNEANMFVTLFVGVLETKTGHLSFCNAGHNPPVLALPGEPCRFMETLPNIPIGVMEDFPFRQQECTLPDGTMWLGYTDGVTEAENCTDVLYGEPRLLATAETLRERSPREIVAAVVADVDAHVLDNPPSDDITLLVIAFDRNKEKKEPALQESITLKNETPELERLAGFIETCSERMDLPMPLAMKLDLALEEAVANVILYAYPGQTDQSVEIDLERRGELLTLRITDSGIPFDPTAREEPDLSLGAEERPIGGLGIFLVRQLMDSVEYERRDNRNILTMQKTLS